MKLDKRSIYPPFTLSNCPPSSPSQMTPPNCPPLTQLPQPHPVHVLPQLGREVATRPHGIDSKALGPICVGVVRCGGSEIDLEGEGRSRSMEEGLSKEVTLLLWLEVERRTISLS